LALRAGSTTPSSRSGKRVWARVRLVHSRSSSRVHVAAHPATSDTSGISPTMVFYRWLPPRSAAIVEDKGTATTRRLAASKPAPRRGMPDNQLRGGNRQ